MRTSTNTNSEESLVARLTANAAKALLTLILSQGMKETQIISQPEFATSIGLSERSIPETLFELEQSGLIEIITLPHKIIVVCKLHICTQEDGQDAHETSIQEMDSSYSPALSDEPVLRTPVLEVDAEDAGTGSGLIDRCRTADESGRKQDQVKALRGVWDDVFPEDEYPFQRLTEDGARRFLTKGRTAEGIALAITEAVENSPKRIEAPRAFVEAVLKNRDRRRERGEGDGEPVVIDDSLRRLVALGREQFRKE